MSLLLVGTYLASTFHDTWKRDVDIDDIDDRVYLENKYPYQHLLEHLAPLVSHTSSHYCTTMRSAITIIDLRAIALLLIS